MLVLTMKKDVEDDVYLIYPDGVEVKVSLIFVERGAVRMGFLAPKDVNIVRGSVREKLARAKAQAQAEEGKGNT